MGKIIGDLSYRRNTGLEIILHDIVRFRRFGVTVFAAIDMNENLTSTLLKIGFLTV